MRYEYTIVMPVFGTSEKNIDDVVKFMTKDLDVQTFKVHPTSKDDDQPNGTVMLFEGSYRDLTTVIVRSYTYWDPSAADDDGHGIQYVIDQIRETVA